VLVADDSPTVRALVRMELEGAGYSVVEAEDGEQALAVARDVTNPVDVVLLDVEMPVLDGFATIAALKADSATLDLPVVFLTSRTQSEDVVDALRLGAHDYLRKPPEATELLARVGAAVQVTALRAELRRRTEELDRMSRTDHLTGLFNRRHLDDGLHAVLASSRRHAYPFAVLLVDVDHFKSVNDRYGHEAGDRVLQAVAAALNAAVRTEDLVGRWGGEEFLVLAPFTDVSGAEVLGERLREGIHSGTVGSDVAVTVSIGAAVVEQPGVAASAVLRAADRLLYDAKAAGRDRVRIALVG
jgi:diguanylate cyclase (GGDEF)-like protein